MPPTKRIVIPGIPHHITQRGVRKQETFIQTEDYPLLKRLIQVYKKKSGTRIISWCFMPNHIHLLAVPSHEDGLRRCIAPALRSYATTINQREGWSGHLWQGRFASFPVDEPHAIAAARYIDLNPVRAGIVSTPDAYVWSSARCHLGLGDDGLTDIEWSDSLSDDWKGLLASGLSDEQVKLLEKHSENGHPVGSDSFLEVLRHEHGYAAPAPRGRPKRQQ